MQAARGEAEQGLEFCVCLMSSGMKFCSLPADPWPAPHILWSPRSQAGPLEMCVSGHEQYFPAHLIKYLPWLFIAH